MDNNNIHCKKQQILIEIEGHEKLQEQYYDSKYERTTRQQVATY